VAVLAFLESWLALAWVMSIAAGAGGKDGSHIQIVTVPGVRARHRLSQVALRLQGALADDD
jgi:hypothetical protein